MDEWYGCKSCAKRVVCYDRSDPTIQRKIQKENNCINRDYKINVNMRRTFR